MRAAELRAKLAAAALTASGDFQRLSQRGWGRFEVERLDPAGGQGRIALSASVFALEYGPGAGRPVCYMFEGFMTGALRHLLGDAGASAAVECAETQCAAQDHDRCRFEFGVGLACPAPTDRADRRGRRARS